jgi:hypothetical protein
MKIIIAIQKPGKDQPDAIRRWSSTVEALQIQLTPLEAASIEPLGEGAWLIPSENGLSFLVRVLAAAEGDKLPYQLLFAEESVAWKQNYRKNKNLPPKIPARDREEN